MGWEGVDWIHLALDRDKWRSVMNEIASLGDKQNAVNFLSGGSTVSFSMSVLLHGVR